MRRAWLVVMLGGCDLVLGLEERATDANDAPPNPFESATHDEDGDGTADAFDLCPHVNPNGSGDGDGDGIGDDCDPRPATADRRLFFSFADGDVRRLTRTGIVDIDAPGDALVLGAITDTLSYITLDDVDVATADVVLHLTVAASSREQDEPVGAYSEVGISTSHRTHGVDGAGRGDTCFAGSDVYSPPNYLEFDEDTTDLDTLTKRYDGPLTGTRLTVEHHATPAGFGCAITRATGMISNAHARTTPRTETGTVSIATVRLAAKLHYLWVVVPEAPRPATRP